MRSKKLKQVCVHKVESKAVKCRHLLILLISEQTIKFGRDGSQVVSVLAVFLTSRVRIPLTPTVFSVKFVFEFNENKHNKRPGQAHFKQLKLPPQLSGFVCAYRPVALGSNPEHAIYAFSFRNSQIFTTFVFAF